MSLYVPLKNSDLLLPWTGKQRGDGIGSLSFVLWRSASPRSQSGGRNPAGSHPTALVPFMTPLPFQGDDGIAWGVRSKL